MQRQKGDIMRGLGFSFFGMVEDWADNLGVVKGLAVRLVCVALALLTVMLWTGSSFMNTTRQKMH